MRFAASVVLIVVACGTSSQAAESRANEAQRADYLRGFDQGYRESYAPAYVSAYNDGLWEGRSEGYNAGFNPTYDALFQQSFDRAQPIGYERAYGATFELGQRLGAAVVEELRAQGSYGGMTGADYTIWADGSWVGLRASTGQTVHYGAPYDLGLDLGANLGAAQGARVGYDNGHGVYYSRAAEVGRADAALQAPLDGARMGLVSGQQSGMEAGWRDGYRSAFGDTAPGRVPAMGAIELPAIDEDRFLADVLGSDTLAGIRAGRVQGVDSIQVETMQDFAGTIDVPQITDFPEFREPLPLIGATIFTFAPSGDSWRSIGFRSITGWNEPALTTYGYGYSYESPAVLDSGVTFSTTAIPEPTTWLLAALGMASVAILARRRAG